MSARETGVVFRFALDTAWLVIFVYITAARTRGRFRFPLVGRVVGRRDFGLRSDREKSLCCKLMRNLYVSVRMLKSHLLALFALLFLASSIFDPPRLFPL